MLKILLVEDNDRLRKALKAGLEATRAVQTVFDCATGEAALEYFLACAATETEANGANVSHLDALPDAALLDVQLAGIMNGITTAVALRREFPRFPTVFYSIQDDDAYYRDFRRSGILSHYAYVRKTNYLLPEMIVPLVRDAVSGRSFIDPEIEARVQEVRHKDEQSPMALLEPTEQSVAHLLAQGLTNEQIAARLGLRDKRTISRTNGQIYVAWGLADSSTDEKVARTRAALIVHTGRLITWDASGNPLALDTDGEWVPYPLDAR